MPARAIGASFGWELKQPEGFNFVGYIKDHMNRSDWLKQKRRSTEERYDRLWAPTYDKNWGADIDPIHADLIVELRSRKNLP